jgi:hypothetical protein
MCLYQLVPRGSGYMENQLRKSTTLDLHRSSYTLGFVHVQLVMAEHRHAGSGLSLDALNMIELIRLHPANKRS